MNDNLREGENPMAGNVSGYRKLTDAELNLVNRLKARGQDLADDLALVEQLIASRAAEYGTPDAEHYRVLLLGKTNIQACYMWLIHAVAAPAGLV